MGERWLEDKRKERERKLDVTASFHFQIMLKQLFYLRQQKQLDTALVRGCNNWSVISLLFLLCVDKWQAGISGKGKIFYAVSFQGRFMVDFMFISFLHYLTDSVLGTCPKKKYKWMIQKISFLSGILSVHGFKKWSLSIGKCLLLSYFKVYGSSLVILFCKS